MLIAVTLALAAEWVISDPCIRGGRLPDGDVGLRRGIFIRMTNPNPYRSLTRTLADKNSPLLRYMRSTFGYTLHVRREFREAAGEIRVPSVGAVSGTVGTAFDIAVQYMLDHDRLPDLAAAPFNGERRAAVMEVSELTRAALVVDDDNPASIPLFLRGCWALALCTEVFRMGRIHPGGRLDQLARSKKFTAEDLILEGASETDVEELDMLCGLAQQRLLPQLSEEGSAWLEPDFAGSLYCTADADLIIDGCLIELKTTLGVPANVPGGRVDEPSIKTIHQILGYTLFDFVDNYGIESVSLYSPRFGTFMQWSLQEFLDRCAGRPVILNEERAAVEALLAG